MGDSVAYRAGDDDRERARLALITAYAGGYLTLEECETRIRVIETAYFEVDVLAQFYDIPQLRPDTIATSAGRVAVRRQLEMAKLRQVVADGPQLYGIGNVVASIGVVGLFIAAFLLWEFGAVGLLAALLGIVVAWLLLAVRELRKAVVWRRRVMDTNGKMEGL